MQLATISSKRQITIPKDMLEHLGLSFYDKLLIEKGEKSLLLKPVKKYISDETSGSLRHLIDPKLLGLSDEEIKKEYRKKYTKYLVKKLKLSK